MRAVTFYLMLFFAAALVLVLVNLAVIALMSERQPIELAHGAINPGQEFTPDGQTYLATGYDDTAVFVVDLRTGRLNLTLSGKERKVFDRRSCSSTSIPEAAGLVDWCDIRTAAVAPNGRLFATGHVNGDVALWDVFAGKRTAVIQIGLGCAIHRLMFSPDGQLLVASYDWERSSGMPGGPTLRIWNVATSRLVFALDDGWHDYCFAPNGKTFVLQTQKQVSFQLFDVQTWQLRATLSNAYWPIVFDPHSKYIAAPAGDRVNIFLPDDHRPQIHFGMRAALPSIDELGLPSSNTIGIWELETARQLAVLAGHSLPVGSLAFSPDSQLLATGTGIPVARPNGVLGEVKIWNIPSGSQRATIPMALQSDPPWVGTLEFTGAGSHLVIVHRPKAVRQQWDVYQSPPRCLGSFLDEQIVGPIDEAFLGVRAHAYISVWDRHLPAPVAAFPDRFAPDGMVLSPDGSTWALWKSWEKNKSAIAKEVDKALKRDHLLPWGQSVTLVDALTSEVISELPDCETPIFSPDGRYLATQGPEGVTKLWPVPPRRSVWARFGVWIGSALFATAGLFYLYRRRSRAKLATSLDGN